MVRPGSPQGEEADIHFHERAARCLVNAPDVLFDELEGPIAELVKELAKTCGTDREDEIAVLWVKGWNAVRRRAPAPIVASDEPLTDALNDAAGKLADAALARLSKYRPERAIACRNQCAGTSTRSPRRQADTSVG